MQFDWGDGPKVPGPGGIVRSTLLFCAWLAWSRVPCGDPVWVQTSPTLIACLDATVRRFGRVPTYVLTDNPRTVSIDHVAGIPVRHPQIVETARHYGMAVHTCAAVRSRIQGRQQSNSAYRQGRSGSHRREPAADVCSFADREAACARFCRTVNGGRHRESARIPAEALADERARLHTLPTAPHTLALGTTRSVGTDQTIRFGSVRYSTPPGLVGAEV